MGDETSGLFAYVLCGGVGKRLWPLSRADAPKQFHKLHSDRTLLEDTLARLRHLKPDKLRVVASLDHKETIEYLVRDFHLSLDDLLFEPEGRNTAAAIALATQDALRTADDPLLLIAPSDHAISTNEAFKDCVAKGVQSANDSNLVLFGINPDRADTRFGYIEVENGAEDLRTILAFREKPDQKLADAFFRSGNHLWNSGIFLARASVLASQFETHQPAIWNGVKAAFTESGAGEIDAGLYSLIPEMPFDTAIVEKTKSTVVVPATFSWSDLGSWEALQTSSQRTDDGNVISGAIADDCKNSLLSGSGIKIAAHGLSDIVLVATPDIVYAAPVSKAHRLGELFEQSPGFKPETPLTNGQRVKNWLVDCALPFWAEHGVDWKSGGFHERLTFEGKAVRSNKRLRTMARQTWTFSEATRLQLHPHAEQIADHGLDFLEKFARIGGGGFASEFSVRNDVVDPTFQLYDHAMVLLACSSLQDFEPTRASILAIAVLNQLERNFLISKKSGYRDVLEEGSLHQSANAHMHVLDALYAWSSKTGDANATQLAFDLRALFISKIYDASRNIVPEHFGTQIEDNAEDIWSPGHHFEWIHLLLAREACPTQEHVDIAKRLWAIAKSFGTTPRRQLARLELSGESAVVSGTSRSWAQCEAIRAVLALRPHNLPDFEAELECSIDRLFKVHLDPAPSGGWIDEVDDGGNQISKDIPASIFYHVFRSMVAVIDQPRAT